VKISDDCLSNIFALMALNMNISTIIRITRPPLSEPIPSGGHGLELVLHLYAWRDGKRKGEGIIGNRC
jgi:hypothetical protein